MLEILKKLNWIDILTLLLILRTVHLAVSKGLATEAFKFLGAALAIYLSLHYYTWLGELLRGKAEPTEIAADFFDLTAFGILVTAGYLSFVILRKVFVREPKEGAPSFFYRLSALALGAARGVLLTSLILYIFMISGVSYFKRSVNESYFGERLVKAAPAAYEFIWNSVGSMVSGGETHNQIPGAVSASAAKGAEAE